MFMNSFFHEKKVNMNWNIFIFDKFVFKHNIRCVGETERENGERTLITKLFRSNLQNLFTQFNICFMKRNCAVCLNAIVCKITAK